MEKHTETKTHPTQSEKLAASIIHHALIAGDSVAWWRLPNTTEQHLLISKNRKTIKQLENLETMDPGFVISPFLPTASKTYLSADYYFRFENGALLAPSSTLETNSQTWLNEQVFNEIKKGTFHTTPTLAYSTPQAGFIQLVNEAVELIKNGEAEKIVPSRQKQIQQVVDPIDAFEKLCSRYSNAMVSLISTPEYGTWIGATPEILVSIENNTCFRTVALAGTKAWHEGIDVRDVAWTQKEIEEQALVERYIISCFKKIRLREYEEHGPKTVIAGNLMHLMSDFRVDMKATNFLQLGSVMLSLLHPTSAVCGMPMERSLQFLEEREGYARELYSGYLGPVNIQNNTHLFVNLRCLKWNEGTSTLFAGAGVTVDSIPEKEWKETEMKMETLASIVL